MEGLTLNITEKPLEVNIEIDWSVITWDDVLRFQDPALEKQQSEMVAELVTRAIGKPIGELPAVAALVVAKTIVGRLTGESGSSGN